uniref:Clarin 3 n=1 Tax=Sphaeramia orbicularis TaxID=375764 RepID=A0A673C4W4_9TELE
MPSTKKTLHFMSCALATAVSVGILGFGMSTSWAETSMLCETNGTAHIRLELFNGFLTRISCPLFGGVDNFEVTGNAPLILHILVVFFLALCMVCSAGSILIALYNSVSNPYETYMGPIGIYVCSSISACLSVLVLILFPINVSVTSMAEDLVNQLT